MSQALKSPFSSSLPENDEDGELQGLVQLWDALFALVLPMALKAAIELQIPDILAAAVGCSLTLDQIFEELSSHALNKDRLFRIMRFLVHHKIFSQTKNGKESTYGLTKASSWLVKKNNPACFSPFVMFLLHKTMLAPYHHMSQCILEDCDGFQKANGQFIFDYAAQNPSFNEMVNDAMVAGSESVINDILKYYDGFKDVKVLVDVGGGLGWNISRIVEAFPYIRGINFDLAHVVSCAPKLAGVEHIEGDMFRKIPYADAIMLKWILHDHDNERCHLILRNCHNALPKGGKVIIIDMIFGGSNYAPIAFDLFMMIQTPGKERTKEEWCILLNKTGFSSIKIYEIPSLLSIIEAFKL